MGNQKYSWNSSSGLHLLLIWSLVLSIVIQTCTAFGPRKEELETLYTAACLTDSQIVVQCGSNQKIKILSVAYSYEENCNTATEDNECKQTSTSLSRSAQTECDGKNYCPFPITKISTLNNQASLTLENRENIQYKLMRCSYNRILQDEAPMKSMLVAYQCQAAKPNSNQYSSEDPHNLRSQRSLYGRDQGVGSSASNDEDQEFEFCNAYDKSVRDLTIQTENYPATSITNPTCGCTFTVDDVETHFLTGYAHCNGTVVFVTEETDREGITQKYEYTCENSAETVVYIGGGQKPFGSKTPVKIKLSVDAEKSSEESAYKVTWFNFLPTLTKAKKPTKVECDAGSIWLPYTTKLILMIVIPLACAFLIALIILYCIIKKRRRRTKEQKNRKVKQKQKPHREPIHELDPLTSSEEETQMMVPVPVHTATPKMTKSRSRASSIGSMRKNIVREERIDPEGDDEDDLAEFAAQMHRKNEERRRKEMEKRYGLSVSQTPPPMYSSHTMQPNSRRSRSIGSLNPDRPRGSRRTNTHASELAIVGSPLTHQSKSASQSRTSLRSMKRRAPQPPGPPAHRVQDEEDTPRHSPRQLYSSNTAPKPRSRSRGGTPQKMSQPPPHPPNHYYNHHQQPYHSDGSYTQPPYSRRSPPTSVSSPGYSDSQNSDNEEMAIMRPSGRPNSRPNNRPKPAVAPKPRYPNTSNSQYNSNRRYPPAVTPDDLRGIADSESNSDY